MVSHLYRYRSVRQVLDGFNELEAQNIYFCPMADLNDPVETFKDLFWLGDRIVWRSLLRHYILQLILSASANFSQPSDRGRSLLQESVFAVPEDLPQAPVRAIYSRAAETFLSEAAVNRFVELMAVRTTPIHRGELSNYLRGLHPFALDAVFKEFAERGALPMPNFMSAPNPEIQRASAIKMMESAALLKKIDNYTEQAAESFFLANESIVEQLQLVAEYSKETPQPLTQAMGFLCLYFPSAYVGALDKLVHPDRYVACFSANPTNASMWGTYGDGHRGVCLKFKTTPNVAGAPTLKLNKITGLGGSKDHHEYFRSFVPSELRKVEYAPAYPPIDFFRSLGVVSQIALNHFWYKGEGSEFSSCRETAFKDQAARDAYWKAFEASSLFKTAEWAHEEEYRIVLHSMFDLREKPKRTLQYKFEDLSGIVFGARTDLQDKLRIMKIIDQKCARDHRSDFEFSEVRYLPQSSTFHLAPLSLLKIRHD